MSETATEPRLLTRRRLLGYGILGAALAAGTFQFLDFRPGYAGGSLLVQDAHDQAISGAITLIDIRRPDEWKRTGVGQGAHPIDMRREDFIAALSEVAGPDRNAPIALMCARGVRSARLSRRLTDAGYTNIIDVPEGMLGSSAGPGWLAQKLPLTAYEDPDT